MSNISKINEGLSESGHDSRGEKTRLRSKSDSVQTTSDANSNVMADEPLILTTEELAEKLSVSTRTIFNWRKWDEIPFIKYGNVVRFNYLKVVEALESR